MDQQEGESDAGENEPTILPTSSGVPGSTTHAGSSSLDVKKCCFPLAYRESPAHV